MKKKKRKSLRKKINPEKSNKMIYAVAGGLAILVIIFLSLTFISDSEQDKTKLMERTLSYLKTTKGILELKLIPEENRVILAIDQYIEDKDFKKIARYAGIKLTNRIDDQEFTFVLSQNKIENEFYSLQFKNGNILKETILKPQ
jgi:hypothetical protein